MQLKRIGKLSTCTYLYFHYNSPYYFPQALTKALNQQASLSADMTTPLFSKVLKQLTQVARPAIYQLAHLPSRLMNVFSSRVAETRRWLYASKAVLLPCLQRANHPLLCLLYGLKLFQQTIFVVFERLLSYHLKEAPQDLARASEKTALGNAIFSQFVVK